MPNTADFYEDLVRVSGDAMVVSNAQGLIILWNAAAERIFGFSEQEALGQPLDIITPERFRARHWEGYHKTMATGITRYGADVLRVPAIHKDGHSLSIAFTVAMLKAADGRVTAISSTIRDETSRFIEERNLRKKLAELEEQVKLLQAPGQKP